MSRSLIRKNQLHPDIQDLVGQYGSGYFTSIDNLIATGQVLQNQINTAVYITGSQTVSGIKNFSTRPLVNGTGVLLQGEAAGGSLQNVVYTTGDQAISGVKTFVDSGIFKNGLDLQNTSLINAVPSFITETGNFLISGNDNGRVIIAVSTSAITGTIVSGNTTGFNTTIIQGGNGQVRITGSGNIVIREFGNQFRTAGISAVISLLHTGGNSYIMYGNTAP